MPKENTTDGARRVIFIIQSAVTQTLVTDARNEARIVAHVEACVAQFNRATVRLGVHRGILFLSHLLPLHPPRVISAPPARSTPTVAASKEVTFPSKMLEFGTI